MSNPKRPAEREHIRLFGAPRPEPFTDTREGQALVESAKIHFAADADRDHLLALEKLAVDIFYDPLAARAFAISPEEYMRRAGFPQVKLDLNSEEVRIAMAMGDPEVQRTARQADVNGFIDAVLAQGIKPSIGPVAFAAVEISIYFSAFFISWVVATYTVVSVVSVFVKIGVFGKAFLTVEHHKNMLAQIAEYLGDPTFAMQVRERSMERIIEEYVRLHREAEI
jgi:hypothetical protein